MLNTADGHMSETGRGPTLDAGFKNHLHFHDVLIKSNLLCLFGDWRRRVNRERGRVSSVYSNAEGTALVCAPLMTAIFSIPARRMEIIKGKM